MPSTRVYASVVEVRGFPAWDILSLRAIAWWPARIQELFGRRRRRRGQSKVVFLARELHLEFALTNLASEEKGFLG